LIPFNKLGFIFKHFGKRIYPDCAHLYIQSCVENLDKNSTVLDLGGGTGVLSEISYSKNPRPKYIISDPAIGMLKYAPTFADKVSAKAEKLPFKNNSIDCIMIGEALHHFQNIEQSINEIYRVLKDNGKLFIFDFDPSISKGRLIYFFEKILGEPVNFFVPKELYQILHKKGFSVNLHQKEYKYVILGEKYH